VGLEARMTFGAARDRRWFIRIQESLAIAPEGGEGLVGVEGLDSSLEPFAQPSLSTIVEAKRTALKAVRTSSRFHTKILMVE
jgi:hypothetical protein